MWRGTGKNRKITEFSKFLFRGSRLSFSGFQSFRFPGLTSVRKIGDERWGCGGDERWPWWGRGWYIMFFGISSAALRRRLQAPLEDMEIVKDHRVLSVCLVVQSKFQDVIFLVFRRKGSLKIQNQGKARKRPPAYLECLGRWKYYLFVRQKIQYHKNFCSWAIVAWSKITHKQRW